MVVFRLVLHGHGVAEEGEEVQDDQHLGGHDVHSGGTGSDGFGNRPHSPAEEVCQDAQPDEEHHQPRHGGHCQLAHPTLLWF